MAPIVTVHRGELLQIKRMIEKGDLRGDIYGLRTESRQPVIQFVCGENNKSNSTTERESTCQDMLKKRHGLLKLGEWAVSKKNIYRKDVALLFNEEGELISAEDLGQKGTADILKGQSAFRLYEPLTKNRADLLPIPTEEYDKENEHKEAEVTKQQWYSEPDGIKLLQGIYATFPQKGLTILNMSRDKATEDISLSLTVDSMPIAVYFPASFPNENPKVRVDDENDWSEVDLQYEEGMPPEEAVALLCALLLNLVTEEKNKRPLRKQSNKRQERKNNKQNQKLKGEKIQNQSQTPSMSDGQRSQDEPSTGQKQPQLKGEHEQRNEDEPSTGQKQPQLTGENEQRNEDEPSTGQKQPQLTGENEQRNEDEPSTGQKQPQLTGENEQRSQDEPSTGQKQPQLTGENEQRSQDEPSTGQKQPQLTGENEQRNEDEPSTGQKQPQLTGENEQRSQDEPSTGQKQPQLTVEHEQRSQDEPSTGQKQPQLTGENEQRNEDEPSTGQKQPQCTGENEQRNDDEPSTGQKQPQLTGENEQRNEDEPSTGQKQPQLTGENEQRNEDEPSTGQKQPQLTGENEQRSQDEPSTGQKQPQCTGEHEQRNQEHPSPTFEHDQQHQNQAFTGQEQVTTPRNKTDEVTKQTPDENMDIDHDLEKQQNIVENMEIDDEDQQNMSTKF